MSASSHCPDSELSQEALLEENLRLKASIAYLEEEVAELKRLIFGHGGAEARGSALFLLKKTMLSYGVGNRSG
jgi:hypothetical protein